MKKTIMLEVAVWVDTEKDNINDIDFDINVKSNNSNVEKAKIENSYEFIC